MFLGSQEPLKNLTNYSLSHTQEFSYRIMAGPNIYGHTFAVGWIKKVRKLICLKCVLESQEPLKNLTSYSPHTHTPIFLSSYGWPEHLWPH